MSKLEEDIAALAEMAPAQLRERWEELKGSPAPSARGCGWVVVRCRSVTRSGTASWSCGLKKPSRSATSCAGTWRLGACRPWLRELECEGYRTKVQQRASGPHKGGFLYRRGTPYHLLANPIYRGMIVHKGKAHSGEHEPIVEEQLFEQVRTKLADNASGVLLAQEASPAKPAHRQAVRRERSCDDAKP